MNNNKIFFKKYFKEKQGEHSRREQIKRRGRDLPKEDWGDGMRGIKLKSTERNGTSIKIFSLKQTLIEDGKPENSI